ncbi:tripartite motif-containing protein 45-like [Stylophora pistillata]|uniref:tripartite motif-containing protein 45-like n=1 Tax=Stylophora pistillata TaxID=50429 RepID=UPI000C03C283|nr:tripartite motif-containing protein 45-like [Stylophora pistillata]
MGHRRGRITKSHHLMNLEEAVEEGPMAVYMSRPSFCKEHSGEMLKLFCETCDKAVCSDCTVVKHQGHKFISVIDAFGNGKNDVRKILSKTKAQVSTLKDALDCISAMKRSIESQVEKTVQEIGERFQDLTVSLNTRQEELVNGVQELKKAKLNTLQNQQEELKLANWP